MAISTNEVEYVARLARMEVGPEEKAFYAEKLNAILGYIEQLKEIDTTGVPLTTHVLQLENVFREDVLEECLPREQALANAPDSQEGYFRVPRIL